ncbi:hypothetical protein RvY_14312 [Ramazzottius varieornatus]|uniref:Uncharacterized protein n=1 Tax=Ramazzottius varieornatus TaxID=947166 RepID=A0A1D1VVY7_RAMVA|nr:hypothetical protein RvY_14312 [Ramazzottius varieornatus]
MDSDNVQFLEEVKYALESEDEEEDDHIDLNEDVDEKASTIKTIKCPKLCTEGCGYDVLSPDQISVYMDDVVKEVIQVIQTGADDDLMAVLLQIFTGDLEIHLADMLLKLVGDDSVFRYREKKQDMKDDTQH